MNSAISKTIIRAALAGILGVLVACSPTGSDGTSGGTAGNLTGGTTACTSPEQCAAGLACSDHDHSPPNVSGQVCVRGSTQLIGSVVILTTTGEIQNVDDGIGVSLVPNYQDGADPYLARTIRSAVTFNDVPPGNYQLQFHGQDLPPFPSANTDSFYVGDGGSPQFPPPLKLIQPFMP
jgi:hypothetical protein